MFLSFAGEAFIEQNFLARDLCVPVKGGHGDPFALFFHFRNGVHALRLDLFDVQLSLTLDGDHAHVFADDAVLFDEFVKAVRIAGF